MRQRMLRRIIINVRFYRQELRTFGVSYLFTTRLMKLYDVFNFRYKILFHRKKTFTFQKKDYRYLYHRYNFAWKNERAVEVPIIWDFILEHSGKKILEVGNVLSHYFIIQHEVLDKYEEGDGIINEDVAIYSPQKKYDIIVSISTLEHVGWDEIPRNDTKILPTIKNLKKLLNPGGKIMFTLPLGYYNPKLNQIINENKLQLTSCSFLMRISKDNQWKEVSERKAKTLQYNAPYPNANGILIGKIEKY